MTADSDYWARYYEVTVDRPAWETVRIAIERFSAEDDAAAGSGRERNPRRERLASIWVAAPDATRAGYCAPDGTCSPSTANRRLSRH